MVVQVKSSQRRINCQLLLAVSLVLSGCLVLPLPGLAAPSAALAPTDSQMLLLKASGGMFGASENAFSEHAFSTKTAQGLVLWQDTSPDRVFYINPENKSYCEISLAEYLKDHRCGKRGFSDYQSSQVKAIRLPDRTAAMETTYKGQSLREHNVGQVELARVVTLNNVKLSATMSKAWCSIMSCDTKLGFPVNLKKRSSRREQRELGQKELRDLFVYHSLKLVPVDKKRFLIPQGFKPARDKTALYFSESGVLENNDLDDLFRGKVK